MRLLPRLPALTRSGWTAVAVLLLATVTVLVPVQGLLARPRRPGTVRAPANAAPNPIDAKWRDLREQAGDLTYTQLIQKLGLHRAPDEALPFDPTAANDWALVRTRLQLTSEEQALYAKRGLAIVDHHSETTMAGAYLSIYRLDLPVLITSDSILFAFHRAFDEILADMERSTFAPLVQTALEKAHAELQAQRQRAGRGELRQAFEDVDLYLAVARNLLVEKPGSNAGECDFVDHPCENDPTVQELEGTTLAIPSTLGQDERVHEVLAAIVRGDMSTTPSLYGRSGVNVDWSQFKPRAHYTRSVQLRRYFRSLMWLGRADLGFVLAPTDDAFGGHDPGRERLDALLLSRVLEASGATEVLRPMSDAIDFLVGHSDSVDLLQMHKAANAAGLKELGDLADRGRVAKLLASLQEAAPASLIRSQIGFRPPGGGETPLPATFQVFGQRFILDSFLLSKLVFDAISFKGESPERTMPSGLDVAAALGHDEAVFLLEPELTRWKYGGDLLTARRFVEQRPAAAWTGTGYDLWLSSLRSLAGVPRAANAPNAANAANAANAFPTVMRGLAWQRKQLETTLASWAELRHDTILYAKQSYTMGVMCDYPTGYVEPYPAFYEKLGLLTATMAERLSRLPLTKPYVDFLKNFSETMKTLSALAQAELARQPFTPAQRQFLKDTIQRHVDNGGCGGPTITYTGWYAKLIFGGDYEHWKPTVADVHTDPNDKTFLEVATGDVGYAVVAIDSGSDRATYVGPVSSYYELTSKDRLTDETWTARLRKRTAPPPPAWTRLSRGKPTKRTLQFPSKGDEASPHPFRLH